MTQFHVGQEVEVRHVTAKNDVIWRKAKITHSFECEECGTLWKVRSSDGTHGTFVETHIRAIKPTMKELYGDNHNEAFEP